MPAGLFSPINQLPRGMLALLGVQQGGRYPSTWVDSYAPVFDLLYWMVQANSEIRQQTLLPTTTSAAAYLAPSSLTVPAGEVWALTQASADVTTGAGDSMTCYPAVASSNSDPISMGVPQAFTFGAAVRGLVPLLPPQQNVLLLLPGQSLNLIITAITVATSITASLRYRMRALSL
jgi:hypothetical protein